MADKTSTASFTPGKIFISRLKHGDDLLSGIVSLCRENNIRMGTVQAIGALSSAKIAYYDQDEKKYRELVFAGHYEILSLTGTISLKDGEPMCHAHIVLGDDMGNTAGGHLLQGCTVFACEAAVTELAGTPLERGYDETTGLPLWDFKKR